MARTIQAVTNEREEIVWVDQGHTGQSAVRAAALHHTDLKLVTLPEAPRVLVVLPSRWVVERSFAWAACFAQVRQA